MKVRVCHADEGGGGFYRLLEPSRVLVDAGYEIQTDLKADDLNVRVNNPNFEFPTVTYVGPTECDVMVFQRPSTHVAVQVMDIIKARGVKIVVELDDDYWAIDKRSRAFREYSPQFSRRANHTFITTACSNADLVTVSTPALAAIIPNQHVKVLRNCIPAWYLDVTADQGENWDLTEGRRVVGWTGDPAYHAGDLEVTGGMIPPAVRHAGACFFTIGAEQSAILLGFADGEANYSNWVQLEHYPASVKNFSVGIVPLRMGRFNEAKSYLKGLEYAALGVPFVASDTSEYRRLHGRGGGLLAPQKHAWYQQVFKLLTDEAFRDEIAGQGRDFAETQTYEQNAYKWWEAWESVL